MRSPSTKTIADHTFVIGKLGGRECVRLYLDVTRMLGPALAAAAGKLKLDLSGGVSGLKKLLGADAGPVIEAAITVLAERLDTPQVMAMIDKLAEVSTVNGKPMSKAMDAELMGEPLIVLRWLYHALEANLGDFSVVLGDLAARGEAALGASSSTSPSTSPASG
jgi:hypothetical protein